MRQGRLQSRAHGLSRSADAADLLADQYEFADQYRYHVGAGVMAALSDAAEIHRHFQRSDLGHRFGVSLTYVAINTVISVTVALPAAYAFNRYLSSATSICSSGC